jgi:hypothetical protein
MPALTQRVTKAKSPFIAYEGYVKRLQVLTKEKHSKLTWNSECDAALDGEASRELRSAAKLETRRLYGAYFTGTKLSKRLLSRAESRGHGGFIYDPSCGMGDLLLAAAKALPLGINLRDTLQIWSSKLAGTDLHVEFINGAKARLTLLAQQRMNGPNSDVGLAEDLFPNIKVGNGLEEIELFRGATKLLMNPPFGIVESLTDCDWADGQVSEAATFMIKALERIQPGTEVLAILPEVLRSGSFSRHWRERVSQLAEVRRVEPYGIFDDSADIDVFILRLVKRSKKQPSRLLKLWPARRRTESITVADRFEVHVGRVVPHRDKQKGTKYAYIHPRCVAPWKVVNEFKETRRHQGLVYQPPFVAIRRTSRPGHPYRATATVIAGKAPLAVENHLIVCQPKCKTLKACKKLMGHLKSEEVNRFLDKRIRCRHLTVSAVGEIPFYKYE